MKLLSLLRFGGGRYVLAFFFLSFFFNGARNEFFASNVFTSCMHSVSKLSMIPFDGEMAFER